VSFFFQAEDGIRDFHVTGVQTCALPISVRTIALQSERPAVRRVLMGVHAGVLEGFRLSEAMRRQGPAFPPLYRAMVSAGESSGRSEERRVGKEGRAPGRACR